MVYKEGKESKTQITQEELNKMAWEIDPDLWDRAVRFELKKKGVNDLGQVGEGFLKRRLMEQRRAELLKDYEIIEKPLEKVDSGAVSEQEINSEQEAFEERLNTIKISREEVIGIGRDYFAKTGEKPDDKLMKKLVREEKILRLQKQGTTEEKNDKEKDLAEARANLNSILSGKDGTLNTSTKESQEQKEVEFEKLCKEFQEDFRNKKARYSIETKIPKGKDFHGYLEKGYKENYVIFVDGEEKREVLFPSATKGRDIDWLKSGDAMMFLDPLPESQHIMNGEKMQGVVLKYNIDASNLSDIGRDIYAEMKLYIREDLATKIFEQIKANPKNFWEILGTIEPELLSLAPKRETDLSETSGKYAVKRPLGLVVYDEDKFKKQFVKSGRRDLAESEYFRRDVNNFEVLPWEKENNK